MSQVLFDLVSGYASPFPDESLHLYSDLSGTSINYSSQACNLGIVEFTDYEDHERAYLPSIESNLNDESRLEEKSDFSGESDLSNASDMLGSESEESDKNSEYYPSNSEPEHRLKANVLEQAPHSFKDILLACREDTFCTLKSKNMTNVDFDMKPTIYEDHAPKLKRRKRWPKAMAKLNTRRYRQSVASNSTRVQRYRHMVSPISDFRLDNLDKQSEISEVKEVRHCSEGKCFHQKLGFNTFYIHLIKRVLGVTRWLGSAYLSFSELCSRTTPKNPRVYNSPINLIFSLIKGAGLSLQFFPVFNGYQYRLHGH